MNNFLPLNLGKKILGVLGIKSKSNITPPQGLSFRLRETLTAIEAKRVHEIMTPRADIIALEINTSFKEVIKMVKDHHHSRLPIYRDDLDDPVGMVHIRDLFSIMSDKKTIPNDEDKILHKVYRDIIYVPPSMGVLDLFLRMQSGRMHLSLVVDEYGGTDGLVTIEDVMEEIFGEIHDEHDEKKLPTIIKKEEGVYLADARIAIKEVEKMLKISLTEKIDNEMDTLGGLIFTIAGRIPERGEVIVHPNGVKFDVVAANARTIHLLRIRTNIKNK